MITTDKWHQIGEEHDIHRLLNQIESKITLIEYLASGYLLT